jgi:hypothetical protein
MSIAPTETPTAHLTHANRCDRCGSRAYVLAGLTTGQLLFCAHHWHAAENTITPKLTALIDERWQLNT